MIKLKYKKLKGKGEDKYADRVSRVIWINISSYIAGKNGSTRVRTGDPHYVKVM